MESGTGLLLWVAEHRRELRPWLAGLFHTIAAPSQTLLSISPAAWAEAVTSLSDSLAVTKDCTLGPFEQGWKLLAMGARTFSALPYVRQYRPPVRARSWVRVHDPRSKNVRLPLDLLDSVSLWREAIRRSPLGMVMR